MATFNASLLFPINYILDNTVEINLEKNFHLAGWKHSRLYLVECGLFSRDGQATQPDTVSQAAGGLLNFLL